MLAAAVALREGYTYRPDGTLFWKQSFRGEGSYLFATTRHLTAALLASIGETMGEGERLVIASPSFDGGLDGTRFRIAVKEIPQELLERCALATGGDTPHIVHPPVCGTAGE